MINEQTVKCCYENKENWDVIKVSAGFKNWMYLTVIFKHRKLSEIKDNNQLTQR